MLLKDRSAYLSALGIEEWILRKPLQSPVSLSLNIEEQWKNLEEKVKKCQACSLHCSRTQTVFGSGNKNAKLCLVGEAPGAAEDQQGLPFVGKAGKLLTAMLASISINREDIYIANILKCRPPNNRNPSAVEISKCSPFLEEQFSLIKPQIIFVLGRIAASFLLNTDSSLKELRGKIHYTRHQIPAIVTYHPAYLLRNPLDKAKALVDLCFLKDYLSHIN